MIVRLMVVAFLMIYSVSSVAVLIKQEKVADLRKWLPLIVEISSAIIAESSEYSGTKNEFNQRLVGFP